MGRTQKGSRDFLTRSQRSERMSLIRSKDTKPELLVRRHLFAEGFRYRLHDRSLPGSPDLVLAQYGVVILVNGCFWHAHSCLDAKRARIKSHYWHAKLQRNVARERATKRALRKLGWRVLTVWECDLVSLTKSQLRLARLARDIKR